MKQLIIDPEFGMAGDMLAAAFLSAGVPATELIAVMEGAAESLGGATVTADRIIRGDLAGTLLTINLKNPPPSTRAEVLREHLITYLDARGLTPPYTAFALRALDCLIEAETRAHRKMDGHKHDHHHCHLHEAQDIILDICASAWAAASLELDLSHTVCLAPISVGSGQIRFSHGLQDIPAPATAALIEQHQLPITAGPVPYELLTPTGAALLAAFAPRFRPRESFTPPAAPAGVGFGTRDFSREHGRINALKIYLEDHDG